jgi:hypothetical protein
MRLRHSLVEWEPRQGWTLTRNGDLSEDECTTGGTAMPLLDHFHPPLTKVSGWAAFHQRWMTYLADDVQDSLPSTYRAEPGARFGIEVDVAALEQLSDPSANGHGSDWRPSWEAPVATATVPFAVATDELEILVYGDGPEGVRLVGAIELVSPANKERPENRETFVSKIHDYLSRGVGVVIVDLVTSRHDNLHDELMTKLHQPEQRLESPLYTVSYRPTGKNGVGELAMWQFPLTLGASLPTVPLWLLGGICVPVRLGEMYDKAVRQLRLSPSRNSVSE